MFTVDEKQQYNTIDKGCSLKTILDTADWSSDKNFKKFYCRHSLKGNQLSYVNAVFHNRK